MKPVKNFQSFLNEGNEVKPGRIVSSFSIKIPEWEYFNIANADPDYGPLHQGWHDALEELGIKDEEAGVVMESMMPPHRNNFNADINFIMRQADVSRLDYIKVKDDTGNMDDGIIFSVKQ